MHSRSPSVSKIAFMTTLVGCLLSMNVASAATSQPVPNKTNKANKVVSKKAAPVAPIEAELTEQQHSLAAYVHVGLIPCELGANVKLSADSVKPGYFNLQLKNQTFHMAAVESATGALRLEDKKAGAVWLQLANKSMLMNQKAGQRMADECVSPAQHVVAEAMKSAPAQSVLDTPVANTTATASK